MFSFLTTSFVTVFTIMIVSNIAALVWFDRNPQAAAKFLVWITFGSAERAPLISWKHQVGFYLAMLAFYAPLMYISFWAAVAASVVGLTMMTFWRGPMNKVNLILVDVILKSAQSFNLNRAV